MSNQYIIRLSPQHVPTGASLQLIAAIPKRMLRKLDTESIKRYVASQHNLAYEQIESMEPFYR
ncbi:hypothetical protein [Paralysiella testudinis]|uniref:Uncharacterized protein n=1 Tax=Paralysiella testudinis TaxID=2809020 RepID=A0A892ZGR8_9NEIS|nr:hypothetical protein [Paralysiella testudinis]QRQ82132.1 hypothetical protein JQU52_01470 [Paralysiella testudinis]